MPKLKRQRVERTEDWEQLRLLAKWPEQAVYELIRPVVLYGETAAERARQTSEPERTIDRKADQFEAQGIVGLLPTQRHHPDEAARSLPPPMRQLIVDLHLDSVWRRRQTHPPGAKSSPP
jgi:hypothetical protein